MDTEYLKRVGLYILSALLSIGLIFYLGYHIWRSVTKEVDTSPVSETAAEKTIDADAYIFRTETPLSYTVSSGGSVVPSVSEGEKVKLGSEAARLFSNNSADIVFRIAEIDEQLSLLESCSSDGTVSMKDSASLDSDIYSLLRKMRSCGDDGKAADALSLRSEFITSVNKRSILTGSVVDFSSEMAKLENDRASLTSQLGSCLEKISAPVSGYYYSSSDGYESVFNPSLLETIDFTSLKQLLASPAETISAKSAGTLVTDPEWYAVCLLPKSYSEVYSEGGECKVNFNSTGILLDMTVYRTVGSGDTFALILYTDVMPENFDFGRVQSVSLVTAEYTGLKLPVSAVRIVDGETGVYVLDGSTVRFRKISVLFQTEGSYIVETDPDEESGDYPWLRLHDNIIVEGKGMYDGKVVG